MKRFHRTPTRILRELQSYRKQLKELKKKVKYLDRIEEKQTRKLIRENTFRLTVLEIARYAELHNIRGIKLNQYIKEYFYGARMRMVCNGGYTDKLKFVPLGRCCLLDVSLMFYIKKCIEYWRYNNHDELFIDFDAPEPGVALKIDFVPNWITQESTDALYRRKGLRYNPFFIHSIPTIYNSDNVTHIIEKEDKVPLIWKRVIKKRDIPNKRWTRF